MEEQAEIENAWNGIHTGEQVRKVSEYLALFPFRLKRTTRTTLRNGHFKPDHAPEAPDRLSQKLTMRLRRQPGNKDG